MSNSDRIKTSLEIALERSANIEVDKVALKRRELEHEGRRIAGMMISNNAVTLESQLKGREKNDIEIIVNSIEEVLLSNIQLPKNEVSLELIKNEYEILIRIKENKKLIKKKISDIEHLFQQYVEQLTLLEKQIAEELTPSLKKLEEQIGAQLGSKVKISPESNPEYLKKRKAIIENFNAQYNEQLLYLKNQIKNLENVSN
ncbi:MAG: DUF6657 family protein [Spirochaetota bacterium]|nr:DUF6657 family protein [Spirochaetota bacterium]